MTPFLFSNEDYAMHKRIICSIACWACMLLTGASQNEAQFNWGPTVEGCRLSLMSEKAQYEIGEPVIINVVLQNQDREKLAVSVSQPFPYRVELYLPNNDEAPLTLWGHSMNRKLLIELGSSVASVLYRGDSKSPDSLMLNREFDMTLDGRYLLIVHKTVPSETDPNAWIDVSSNKVVIEINTHRGS